MFLRAKTRKKDGKQHRYWSVVENKRVAGGRVVQKHVLYLGDINDSQELAWRKSIDVLDQQSNQPNLELVSGGPMRGRTVGRLHCPAEAVGAAVVSAAAMGRLLVGPGALGRAAARLLLGRAAAGQPKRNPVGGHSVRAGQLSAAGAGQ